MKEDKGRSKVSSCLLQEELEGYWALTLALSHKLVCTEILQAELLALHFISEGTEVWKGQQLGSSTTRLRHDHLNCIAHILLKVSPGQFPKFWLLQVSFDVSPVTFCYICLFVWNR